jgi:hypothetical protein
MILIVAESLESTWPRAKTASTVGSRRDLRWRSQGARSILRGKPLAISPPTRTASTDARVSPAWSQTSPSSYCDPISTALSFRRIRRESARSLAGGPGFEPRLTGSEPVVLPLNYPPPDPMNGRQGAGCSDAWPYLQGRARPSPLAGRDRALGDDPTVVAGRASAAAKPRLALRSRVRGI